jgi:hypothetical protein
MKPYHYENALAIAADGSQYNLYRVAVETFSDRSNKFKPSRQASALQV